MTDQTANFIEGTVSTGYDETATTIVLNSGHDFPDPSGDNYNVVWYDSTNFPNPALDPKVEINRVTALSTNTITITRAQEGTSATTKNTSGATYKMILGPTAKTITDLQADTTAVGAGLTTHMSDTSTHGVAEIANVATVSAEIDSDITTHAGLGDAHHAESHTVVSHSDTTATGVELEILTDGSDADSLHAHAVNDAKVTNASHTGDVTGATALTIGADKVNDTHIDWGTGVNQVSAVDIPIADAGVIITATEIEGALQENRTAIDLNTAKNTNVSTSLSVGTVGVNTVAITSDGGADDVTLPAATVAAAGMLTTTKWAEIVANNAKITNVSTDLSEGTSTETTVDVNSSDGTNATLVAASALRAGLLTKAKFDEIVANNAKVTNATHTGEVTGSGALTIADAAVTYAKIQNVVNDDVFLGRISGADGDVEEISKANALTLLSVEDGADVTDAFNVAQAWLGEVDKNTPIDNDTFPIADSAVSNVLKKVKWSNIKATLKTYFDTLYNLYSHPNHTGEVTSTGDGATVITADAVTYDKMQDTSATDKLLGRSTIGAGTIEEIACTAAGRAILDDTDAATQRTTLDVDQSGTDNSTDVTLNASATTGGLSLIGQDISHRAATNLQTGYMTDALVTNIETNNAKVTNATHTSDVTGDTALTIAADAVTYSKMQNVVNDERILGRVSGANGVVEELTAAQVLTMINVEAAADVTDAVNVNSAGAVMESDIPDQSFTNLLENGDFESWSAGTSSAPDGWVPHNSPTIVMESTIVKTGSNSIKVTATQVASRVYYLVPNYSDYKGDIITLSSYVYASAVGAKIQIRDGITSSYSNEHSGTPGWELLTISKTISLSATQLRISVDPDITSGTGTAYYDSIIAVKGSICPAFSPKPLSANDLTIHMQTPQTLTGAGAVDIVSDITHIVTTAADALTLIDGAEGQEKFIVMKTDANDGTLTPTNLGNGTTITFNDVGDSAHLLFTNGAWHFIGGTATLA